MRGLAALAIVAPGLLSCAIAVAPPSFAIAGVEAVRAYTDTEAVFVERTLDGGILVVGNFGSPLLPTRAFAEVLQSDGGQARPAPELFHQSDPFLATHAVAAVVLGEELLVSGAADNADMASTTMEAWETRADLDFPGYDAHYHQRLAPLPKELDQDFHTRSTRLAGAVHRFHATERDSWARWGNALPNRWCVAGNYEADAGAGAFFSRQVSDLPRLGFDFASGGAAGVTAHSLALVESHCLAVGQWDGGAVLFDLGGLAFIGPYTHANVDPATLVRVGADGRPSDALAINRSGDVVGWEAATSAELGVAAIRVSGKDTRFRLLPLPPEWHSGRALSSTRTRTGQVVAVGWGVDENGRKRALIWVDASSVFPLDTLVLGLESHWALEEATSIDALLDIVGNGHLGERKRAFLLILGAER